MKNLRCNRAVFLDRDGTLCVEIKEHLRDASQIQLLPGLFPALRQLRERGFELIVVTNQSGVARGYFTEAKLTTIHQAFRGILAQAGISLTDIYYCPHLPEGVVPEYSLSCQCRKPGPGLILRAAEEHGLELRASYLVGDKPSDIQSGKLAGCRTILLAPDPSAGESGAGPASAEPDFIASSWEEVAQWILGMEEP